MSEVRWRGGMFLALWLLLPLPLTVRALEPDAPLNRWLLRVQEASKHRAYTGTFVVSAGGNLASAKIWHVCDGTQQVERVEPLTGVPRATYRRNDQVVTLYPQSKIAVVETRESLGMFPALLKSTSAPIGDFYRFKALGTERLAGFEADAVALTPKDTWRYAYRVWNEKRSGLVLQLQTLDANGRVIEQSAFSELQLDAPVKMAQLVHEMDSMAGYQVSRPAVQPVTADAMGWNLTIPVPGFRSAGCFSRTLASNPKDADNALNVVQWIFTDGLATLSVFVESFDAKRHLREGTSDMGGATHIVTRKLGDSWVTAVGEVPAITLGAFAGALERRK